MTALIYYYFFSFRQIISDIINSYLIPNSLVPRIVLLLILSPAVHRSTEEIKTNQSFITGLNTYAHLIKHVKNTKKSHHRSHRTLLRLPHTHTHKRIKINGTSYANQCRLMQSMPQSVWQIQQNSFLQREHVTCMQPPLRSIAVWQPGQGLVVWAMVRRDRAFSRAAAEVVSRLGRDCDEQRTHTDILSKGYQMLIIKLNLSGKWHFFLELQHFILQL